MLQYITNTKCGKSIPEQVKAVLEGGCRWIQLDMGDASNDELLDMAKKVKELTDAKEAFLVINHSIDVCRDANATGVNLSQTDVKPSKARVDLGPLAVIGIEADTFDEINAVRALDIDYISIGPLKSDNGDAIGLEGIASLCTRMKEADINIAHVASGGVTLDDVKPLLEAGVDGIAVSDAIAFADNMAEATRKYCDLLPTGD